MLAFMVNPSIVIIIAYTHVHRDTSISSQTITMAQNMGSLRVTTWSLLNDDTALALVA